MCRACAGHVHGTEKKQLSLAMLPSTQGRQCPCLSHQVIKDTKLLPKREKAKANWKCQELCLSSWKYVHSTRCTSQHAASLRIGLHGPVASRMLKLQQSQKSVRNPPENHRRSSKIQGCQGPQGTSAAPFLLFSTTFASSSSKSTGLPPA